MIVQSSDFDFISRLDEKLQNDIIRGRFGCPNRRRARVGNDLPGLIFISMVCCVFSLTEELERCSEFLCKCAFRHEGYMELEYNFRLYQEEEVLCISTPEDKCEIGKVSEIELVVYQD